MTEIKVESLKKKRLKPDKETKIVLLGLTPGKQQHTAIEKSTKPKQGAFKGYMRTQMFEWFKELGIKRHFNLVDENTMFKHPNFDKKVYTTSLLKDPVYVYKDNKKMNYTGRSPLPWKHEELRELMYDTFRLLNKLNRPTLIIPMGQIVSTAIKEHSELDDEHFILHGFPHPSGANARRNIEFAKNKKSMRKVLKEYFREEDKELGKT